MSAPINSIKHYTAVTNTSIASGANLAVVVADSVVAPATGNAFDVKEGAVLKAVHLEYWLLGDGTAGQSTQFIVVVEKVPANVASISAAQMLNIGAYTNKKNIFFTSQGIVSNFTGGATTIPVIRDWMLIPKGKQRMGLSDRIVISFAAVGTAVRICGIATYKEYS